MTIHSTMISGYRALEEMWYLLPGESHVLLITDKNIRALPAVQALMANIQKASRLVTVIDTVPPEPSQHDVTRVLEEVAGAHVDMVVGIGGGSVLDVAKLMSVLCADNAPSLAALLAGDKPVRRTRSLLIPTTAGTGSEATPNAILALPEQETKVGIISPVMLPDYVALLPELTISMPAHIAASTGIDALCHLIECFTATIANPVSDNYALIGMKKLFENLELTVNEPTNQLARLNMLWASWFGGAAITHAGTHLIHAMSYPLGGKYHLPHGIANAILLAPCMKFLRPSLVDKFAQAYDLLPDADLSLDAQAKSHALVAWFTALVKRLNLPSSLETLGVSAEDLPYLVESALNVKRLMKNVPAEVTADDVREIYQTLFTAQ